MKRKVGFLSIRGWALHIRLLIADREAPAACTWGAPWSSRGPIQADRAGAPQSCPETGEQAGDIWKQVRTLPFSLSSLSVLFSIFVEEKIFLFHKIKREKSLVIRKTKEVMFSRDPRKPVLTLLGALSLEGKSRQEISTEPA